MNSNHATDLQANFYRAFEDKFRGTREVIKSRLMVYLPFIDPLKEIYNICSAIDLGCGRGEWLELITEAGIAAHGVDLDDGMLAACRERGLSVETADAISYLESLPDESQTIVSGFHIIEHIPFPSLQIMVQEALRVLKPAGLLIFETPNPENIIVSTSSFYLDPTHIHPIPQQLLAFLTEHYGFHRNKIMRLQESSLPNNRINLFDVLYGVSFDYSVVAQKQATEEQLVLFNSAFDREYGLSLENLAARYDAQYEAQIGSIRSQYDAQIGSIQFQVNNLQMDRDRLQNELNHMYQSRSWRVTAPLRKVTELGLKLISKIRRS